MKSIPVENRKRVAICVASSNLIDAPYLLRWISIFHIQKQVVYTRVIMHHHIYRRRRDFPSPANERFFLKTKNDIP
ncbi:hypothetical protein GHT06_017360 [Daphnia sinensis]|uniref:Uncharacterized protein n=1 Tax=Daphnia sinensis TaxID=1820382 RepID=A0AAD5KPR7_9CRUS|nr:hypothetical protein GHT06_017360 [Daphnia sinensis]